MQTYTVKTTQHRVTIRAESEDAARAHVAPAIVESVRLVHEPDVLTRWRDRMAKEGARREPAPVVDPRYTRSKFATAEVYLSDVLKHYRGRAPTFGDVDNDVSENVDMSYCYFRGYDPSDDIKDACAIVVHLCPNMPRRVLDLESVADDLSRSKCRAAETDYRDQFTVWLRKAFEYAANITGAPWAWLESSGAASAYPWDANQIGFALSRRAFLKGGHWEAQQSWETQREYMDRASDVLQEYVSDVMRDKVDMSDFDERGSVYADDENWPEYMLEDCNTAQEWEQSDTRMREQLKRMIKARAPLDVRAALVATVYGAPGSLIGEDA
jgi:hypothetical protein